MAQPSFIFNIPIFSSSLTGRNSSLHQSHVAYHAQGFALMEYIHSLLDAKEDNRHANLFPEALLSREVVNEEDTVDIRSAKISDASNWTVIALANPVSGKGIPKNFNFIAPSPYG
jgi:hypothetical protein